MEAIFSIVATPFGYVMRWIYQLVGNYGLSIILFAILAKLVMMPLTIKQKRSMLQTQRLQPKLLALQKKYGKDQQRYNAEVQALYEREGASPMAGCGTTLITFPIMIGLYYVISKPLSYFMQLSGEQVTEIGTRLGMAVANNYTSQISIAGAIHDNFNLVSDISDKLLKVDFHFLGMDLAATPNFKVFNLLWLIPILSGLTAFGFSMFQRYLTKKANPAAAAAQDQASRMTNTMLYIMPLMSVYFGFILPAGLGLYWITNNILSAAQEAVLSKIIKLPPEPEPPPKKKKKKPKPVELDEATGESKLREANDGTEKKPKQEVLTETPKEVLHEESD